MEEKNTIKTTLSFKILSYKSLYIRHHPRKSELTPPKTIKAFE